MQKVFRVLSTGERELFFITPGVVSHHKNAYRRAGSKLVASALERVVVPGQYGLCRVKHGFSPEDDVTNLSFRGCGCMRPGAEQQTLTGARFRRCRTVS